MTIELSSALALHMSDSSRLAAVTMLELVPVSFVLADNCRDLEIRSSKSSAISTPVVSKLLCRGSGISSGR